MESHISVLSLILLCCAAIITFDLVYLCPWKSHSIIFPRLCCNHHFLLLSIANICRFPAEINFTVFTLPEDTSFLPLAKVILPNNNIAAILPNCMVSEPASINLMNYLLDFPVSSLYAVLDASSTLTLSNAFLVSKAGPQISFVPTFTKELSLRLKFSWVHVYSLHQILRSFN